MKRISTLLVVILVSMQAYSQDSKITVTLNYPIPIDTNFIGNNYSGIIDGGFDFRFTEAQFFSFGGSLNIGVLASNRDSPNFSFESRVTAVVIQPRLFTEVTIEALPMLHPYFAAGFSFVSFNASEFNDPFDTAPRAISRSGYNVNAGLSVDITNRLLVRVQYDFLRLSNPDDIPEVKFNKNVNILKLGVGYRL